jgi:hypothetical protein
VNVHGLVILVRGMNREDLTGAGQLSHLILLTLCEVDCMWTGEEVSQLGAQPHGSGIKNEDVIWDSRTSAGFNSLLELLRQSESRPGCTSAGINDDIREGCINWQLKLEIAQRYAVRDSQRDKLCVSVCIQLEKVSGSETRCDEGSSMRVKIGRERPKSQT